VGTGGIARTTVADLHLTDELELVGVASRDPHRAAAFAAEFEVPTAYQSYEQLFDDDGVDVVYIGTPISTHAEIAERALRAGKHVLVEKAFATTAAEARTVTEVARERKRFLMEAMWMRFNPAISQMLDDVAGGIIGDVRTVQAGFGIPLPPSFNIWRPELGGGALLDMGVYAITLAHLLLGVPQDVHAVGEMRSDGLDITDSVFLRYDDGRFAQAVTSLVGFVNPVASIGGTRGFITFDRPFMSSGEYRVETPGTGAPTTVRVELEGNGYVPMFRAVSHAVTDGLLEHPLRPLASTIAVLSTMDEIRRQLTARSAQGDK
jgi:predicted dehydrogenase